ncbi:MAG: hypothetical protein M3Z20_17880 [Chloroflexota bacterium]|nr:hypothetical protein [Chloroflexota bacterium]
MADIQNVGSLEIDQDLDFQQKEWRLQRICWSIMALLIVAALLGLTGSGPLARAAAGDAGAPLQLEYSRFVRLNAPTTLDIEIAGEAIAGDQVELRVARAYLQDVSVEQIVPEPAEVRSAGDHLIFVFAVAQPGQPVAVTFDLRHTAFGPTSGQVGLADEMAVDFGQLILP